MLANTVITGRDPRGPARARNGTRSAERGTALDLRLEPSIQRISTLLYDYSTL